MVGEPQLELGDGSQAEAARQPASQPMSKNQQKKAAKWQRILEGRKEKRRIEKEKRKLRRKQLAQQRQENGDQTAQVEVRRKKLMSESDNKFKVVIDMDFEDYMTDEEIRKASKQVGRIYSLNRHSDRPCQLYITSLRGKLRDRFSVTNTGYEKWDVNTTESDYLELFADSPEKNIKEDIIYLTADSAADLPSAEQVIKDDSKIYVIGGLVDHNRHKNLCYNRAQERQIKTAKLPLKENVQLCQRHILSTVTVFEILLKVLGSHMSWREAFLESIPKRKLLPTRELPSENKANDNPRNEGEEQKNRETIESLDSAPESRAGASS